MHRQMPCQRVGAATVQIKSYKQTPFCAATNVYVIHIGSGWDAPRGVFLIRTAAICAAGFVPPGLSTSSRTVQKRKAPTI
jgi:hypothetical protein